MDTPETTRPERSPLLQRLFPERSPLQQALDSFEAKIRTAGQDNRGPRYDAGGRKV